MLNIARLFQRASCIQLARCNHKLHSMTSNSKRILFGLNYTSQARNFCGVHSNVIFSNENNFYNSTKFNHNIKRYKKKKRSAKQSENEAADEDDDDEDELANENPLLVDDLLSPQDDDSQQVTIDVNSLRMDSVAKVAFGMTRASIEEHFYKGGIYVNGELPTKKSQELYKNDEIDLIKQTNAEDSKLVDIKRAIIIEVPDKATEQGRLKLKIKRWANLTVEPPKARRPSEE